MRTLALLATAILLAACAAGTTIGGGVSSAPIFGYPSVAWDVRPEGRQWTTIANAGIDRLAPQLTAVAPTDIDAFCPGYKTASPANRRAFYVSLLGEIARFESNFDPSVKFTESFNDARGQRVVSRGLLQLSQESANQYGCAIASAEQLHDPATNIECGVRILDRWLTRDQVVAGYASGAWRGASRYWGVLRDREKLVDIQAATNAQPYCKRRTS
jgi:soluble lytic murein transglycosylase-like protein